MKSFYTLLLSIGLLSLLACQPSTSQGQEKKYPVQKSEAEWKKQLTEEQFYILREKGTERAGSSALLHVKGNGTFACAACKNPLFTTASKYESGTGWPSFFAPIDKKAVAVNKDRSYGMVRDEVVCSRCGGHLGHVFDDGPEPTGLRYCMNGDAMIFEKKP